MKEKSVEKETKYSASIHETAGGTPRPSLFRNYISFVGVAVVAASLTSIVLLLLIEFTGDTQNPYSDLITYILVPTILVFRTLYSVGRCADRAAKTPQET